MAEINKEQAKKDLEAKLAQEASKVQKTQEESLPEAERKALEIKKAEEVKKAEDARVSAEVQAKKDAELILKKDEEIKDEVEKKRKTELLEAKRKEEDSKLSAEDRIKKVKEESQKRIDEIHNKLKELEDKSSKESRTLKLELETLRKEKESPKSDDIAYIIEKEESERIKKYLEEDKSLPREKRREMSKDELNDWMLEDTVEATAWINRREIRREIDKRQNFVIKQKEGLSKKLFREQTASYAKVVLEHPELNIKSRMLDLKNQGKTEEEAESIIRSENKKYDLILKIADENPDWKFEPNAPEMAAKEMAKRISKESESDNKSETDKIIEKLQARIEALETEKARESSFDEGVNSNLPGNPKGKSVLTELEKNLVEIMTKNKATPEMIDSALEDLRKKKK
jgi:unconventional prefoldin RPB5 interactor 1